MSDITITVGDVDFQNTLTDRETQYIHEGMNWISKWMRETQLKAYHNYGYTLDEIEKLSEEKQVEIKNKAIEKWNNEE